MSNNGTGQPSGNGDKNNVSPERAKADINFFASQDELSDPENLLRARQNVATARASSETTSIVEYRSNGHCLVVAAAADEASVDAALVAASRLPDLKTTVLCPLGVDDKTVAAKQATETGVKVFYRYLNAIQGYLGHFDVLVQEGVASDAKPEHLGVLALTDDGMFDLVLDLRTEDAAAENEAAVPGTADSAALAPFGFFRAANAADLHTALQTLPDLVGEFEKPKYFKYDAAVCAHSRSEINGCSNCLDVCATGAIASDGDGVTIDPYLCQGCGHCSAVCPSGAMTYAYPTVAESIVQSRELMLQRETRPAVLLLHGIDESLDAEDESASGQALAGFEQSLPIDVLALAVEEPAAFGVDYWAAMIASGIKRIVVLLEPVSNDGENTDAARTENTGLRGGVGDLAVREQAGMLGLMLAGLGLPADMVRVIDSRHTADFAHSLKVDSPLPEWPPASFATHNDKRQTLRLAMDHLGDHLPPRETSVALPGNSPFGQLQIKQDNCTLCMACVTTCPAGALLDGHSVPQLKFVEANCVQCGLCEAACPEDALGLSPRYLYDSVAARQQQILNEEEPFHCVRCHKAFATRKMINTMTGKLAGHWMFKDETAVRRLKMCEDCRVKDMFEESRDGIQVHKSESD